MRLQSDAQSPSPVSIHGCSRKFGRKVRHRSSSLKGIGVHAHVHRYSCGAPGHLAAQAHPLRELGADPRAKGLKCPTRSTPRARVLRCSTLSTPRARSRCPKDAPSKSSQVPDGGRRGSSTWLIRRCRQDSLSKRDKAGPHGRAFAAAKIHRLRIDAGTT